MPSRFHGSGPEKEECEWPELRRLHPRRSGATIHAPCSRGCGTSRLSQSRSWGFRLADHFGALVLVPLFELVRETITVQPYDRAFLPKAQPGELTLFHYERVFAGRLSWAIFYKPFFNSLVTAFGATVVCLSFGAGLAWLIVRTNIPYRNTLHTLVMIPYMLPSWVIALAWVTFFKNDRIGGASGAFAYFFGAQPPDWIAYGPVPIIICLSLHYYVYSYLSVLELDDERR